MTREPVAGASRARNRGLAWATTDIVVFVDDDVMVDDGWLDALVEPLSDPDVVATVGPITLDCAVARPPWLTPNLESWFSALDLGSHTRSLGPFEHGWSANLAVRRSAARGIGGFDTRLGPGMPAAFGEDADFLDRLRGGGGEVVYADRASVRHRVGPDRLRVRWLARRAYEEGVTEVALGHRHGSVAPRRRPIRAMRSLGGAVVRGFPRLVRTARDPACRPGLLVEQMVIWSAKVGAVAGHWSPRVLGPMAQTGFQDRRDNGLVVMGQARPVSVDPAVSRILPTRPEGDDHDADQPGARDRPRRFRDQLRREADGGR
jgi:hypothetical protein